MKHFAKRSSKLSNYAPVHLWMPEKSWGEGGGFFRGYKSYLFYIEKRRALFHNTTSFSPLPSPFPRQSNSPTQQLFLSLSTLFPSHSAPLHAHPHPPLPPVWGLCFIVVLHLAGNTPTRPPLCGQGRSPTACEHQA